MASEMASVAPLVKVSVRGVAPTAREARSRACTTASSAAQPRACSEDGLP